VPTYKRESVDLALEMHSHCTTGLAPLCCLDSVPLGVDIIDTCVSPLANGPSHPSAENMIMNLKRLGYAPRAEMEPVEKIAEHFRYVARRENKPMGAPVEYDVFQYVHQVPGGMISNLEFMLSERGMAHRLEEVLEEISLIREEWGYPVMITPFSQLVGTQGVLNVLQGERYKVATAECIRYVLGHYGKTPAPVDPNVLDKITALPEAKEFLNWEQPRHIGTFPVCKGLSQNHLINFIGRQTGLSDRFVQDDRTQLFHGNIFEHTAICTDGSSNTADNHNLLHGFLLKPPGLLIISFP